MKRKKYHSRKFLNKSSGMAAIEVSCSVSSYSIDCGIAISDCNRKIELDFYSWDKKTTKEKLNKLDLIIEELTLVRDWMVNTGIPEFEIIKDKKSNFLESLDDQ